MVLSACDDSSTGSEPSPVGTYVLLLVGGQDLPVQLPQSAGVRLALTSGGFVVRRDGNCEQSFDVMYTYPDSVRNRLEAHDCSWQRTGNTLVMDREDGYRATAQILGSRLELDGPNLATLTYEK